LFRLAAIIDTFRDGDAWTVSRGLEDRGGLFLWLHDAALVFRALQLPIKDCEVDCVAVGKACMAFELELGNNQQLLLLQSFREVADETDTAYFARSIVFVPLHRSLRQLRRLDDFHHVEEIDKRLFVVVLLLHLRSQRSNESSALFLENIGK